MNSSSSHSDREDDTASEPVSEARGPERERGSASCPGDDGPSARSYGLVLLGALFRAWGHELNNPVQALLMMGELNAMRLSGPVDEGEREQLRSDARSMVKESLRVAEGLALLQAFARPLADVHGVCSPSETWQRAKAAIHPYLSQRQLTMCAVKTEGGNTGDVGALPTIALSPTAASWALAGVLIELAGAPGLCSLCAEWHDRADTGTVDLWLRPRAKEGAEGPQPMCELAANETLHAWLGSCSVRVTQELSRVILHWPRAA